MDHLETEEGVVPLVEDYVVAFPTNLIHLRSDQLMVAVNVEVSA